jgi:Ca2+-binding EF-hand superfamily protein
LDRRSAFIETEEREDIFNAFKSILDDVDLKIDRESLQKVMDGKRSW